MTRRPADQVPLPWAGTPLRVVNLLVFIPLIVGNAWAGSGGLSGESIGVIANRWPTLLLPASWTFGIWSLIYLGLAAFVVYQVLPLEQSLRAAGRIGPLWLATVALNLAWITAFSFSRFGSALIVMVMLLVALLSLFDRLEIGRVAVGRAERVLVQAPFSLYLGWIIVAFVVNTAQYLAFLGWEGPVVGPLIWAVVAMLTVTAIATLLDLLRGEWIVSLVVAWALIGIASRYPDLPVLAGTAWTLAGVNLAGPLMLRAWRRRQGAADPEKEAA